MSSREARDERIARIEAGFHTSNCLCCADSRFLIAELRASLSREAEATKDAERLNAFENAYGDVYPESAVHSGWNSDGEHDEEEGWAVASLGLWFRDLRSAIDALDVPRALPQEKKP